MTMARDVANVLLSPSPFGQFGALAVGADPWRGDAFHANHQYIALLSIVEDPVHGIKHRCIIDVQMSNLRGVDSAQPNRVAGAMPWR